MNHNSLLIIIVLIRRGRTYAAIPIDAGQVIAFDVSYVTYKSSPPTTYAVDYRYRMQ